MKSPIRCGPRIEPRAWRDLPNEELTRAERNMRFVEKFCRIPEGNLVGKEVRLAPYQERFFYDVYDNPRGTRRAYLSIARKNAKTATIAFIVLVHLVGPEASLNSHLQSGAMSREQASQVYKYASKTIAMSKQLSQIVKNVPSRKMLLGVPMNVEYLALSAEGKTAHGGSGRVIILDEAGQIRGEHSDFVEALETSQGAYDDPLMIVISTQAPSDSALLSIWLDDAERSQDPHIVSHVYEAPKDCDLMDEAAWYAANPAMGLFRSKKDVEEQAKKAERMPSFANSFRNLTLNQRVSTVASFVTSDVWRQNIGEPVDFGDTPVYAGLDLSGRTDLTSLVLIGKIDGIWHVQPHFWTPEEGIMDRSKVDRAPYDRWASEGLMRTTPGATVDYSFVAYDIINIIEGLNLQSIAFDRWRINELNRELDNMGASLPLIECGQGFKDMSPAIDTLEAELLNGRIAHGNHPVLTLNAANAVVSKDPAGNRKLNKALTSGRIDGMVSLCMAFFAASNSDENETTDLTDYFNQMVS